MSEHKLLNIRTNRKHSILEYLIKKHDPSQDMSRAAVFEREVRAGENVKDWGSIKPLLSGLEECEDAQDAPIFTNLQAKYDRETESILAKVRKKMFEDLHCSDFKILQTQYMVLLLQANYLETLKHQKLTINTKYEETNITMPEMAQILCEIMLTDKDCKELKEIRKILIDWRNEK